MHVQKNSMVGALVLPLLLSFCDPVIATNGRLYDQRNQYFVTCRLHKEKRVEMSEIDLVMKSYISLAHLIYNLDETSQKS